MENEKPRARRIPVNIILLIAGVLIVYFVVTSDINGTGLGLLLTVLGVLLMIIGAALDRISALLSLFRR